MEDRTNGLDSGSGPASEGLLITIIKGEIMEKWACSTFTNYYSGLPDDWMLYFYIFL